MSSVLNEDELWALRGSATRLRHEAELLVELSGRVRRDLAQAEYAGRAADALRGRMSVRDRVLRSLAVDLEEVSLAILRRVSVAEEGREDQPPGSTPSQTGESGRPGGDR